MSFPSEPLDRTSLAAESVVDMIKIAVARSVVEKAKIENLQDSVVRTKFTRTEILWYLENVYSKIEAAQINKDRFVAEVLKLLPDPRLVRFKTGTYSMHGEPVKEGAKLIGIMMVAHDHKVIPSVRVAEPAIH
jgi:hypothetical protein